MPLPVTHETTLERFKQTMDVNLQGTFSMSSHYLREVLSPNNQNEAPRGGYAIVSVQTLGTEGDKGVEDSVLNPLSDGAATLARWLAFRASPTCQPTYVLEPAQRHPPPATRHPPASQLTPAPRPTPQCASKHAIVGLSKTMAKEYATRHVRVNVVAPGAIETPLLEALLDQAPHASGDVSDTIPMRRIGQAEEVASVICFLLGPESGYVTVSVEWD